MCSLTIQSALETRRCLSNKLSNNAKHLHFSVCKTEKTVIVTSCHGNMEMLVLFVFVSFCIFLLLLCFLVVCVSFLPCGKYDIRL